MLKEILLSGKYEIENVGKTDNKIEEEKNDNEKKVEKEKEKIENLFEQIINKSIDLSIQSKNYEYLELILSNRIRNLMKFKITHKMKNILKTKSILIQNLNY